MAFVPDATDGGSPVPGGAVNQGHIQAPGLRGFVFALFFIFGGITSLNDVLIPKFKELFDLSYFQAMLVQSAFFAAYLIISIPGALLVKRVGYMRGAVAGLLTMMAGCLLFIPASQTAAYGLFLAALFVLASGVTIVQVVANPLISLLGPASTSHSRLTFAQAFNSLGTTLFPYFGSIVILGGLAAVTASELSGPALNAYRAQESEVIVHAYLGLAAALAVVAAVVWAFRNRLKGEVHEASTGLGGFDLLKRPRFAFGAASIFLYVGAEVTIGSLIVSYLMQDGVMGLSEQAAGTAIPLYWGGALLGRFIGSGLLRLIRPGLLLASVAGGAIFLILISTSTGGWVSGYSLLAIGLMNAIMFPTIFSLACEGLGKRAADASGVICLAIVGGAVIPPLTGALADISGSLALALILPAACYATIGIFGTVTLRGGAFGLPNE